MQTAVAQCGDNIGNGTVSVNAGMISGTDINYFPITGFDATIGLDKIMAAFAAMDNESDYLEYQLVCRTANDPRAPNAWQTMEASWTNPTSSNTLRNTGALSAPAGANVSSNLAPAAARSPDLASRTARCVPTSTGSSGSRHGLPGSGPWRSDGSRRPGEVRCRTPSASTGTFPLELHWRNKFGSTSSGPPTPMGGASP